MDKGKEGTKFSSSSKTPMANVPFNPPEEDLRKKEASLERLREDLRFLRTSLDRDNLELKEELKKEVRNQDLINLLKEQITKLESDKARTENQIDELLADIRRLQHFPDEIPTSGGPLPKFEDVAGISLQKLIQKNEKNWDLKIPERSGIIVMGLERESYLLVNEVLKDQSTARFEAQRRLFETALKENIQNYQPIFDIKAITSESLLSLKLFQNGSTPDPVDLCVIQSLFVFLHFAGCKFVFDSNTLEATFDAYLHIFWLDFFLHLVKYGQVFRGEKELMEVKQRRAGSKSKSLTHTSSPSSPSSSSRLFGLKADMVLKSCKNPTISLLIHESKRMLTTNFGDSSALNDEQKLFRCMHDSLIQMERRVTPEKCQVFGIQTVGFSVRVYLMRCVYDTVCEIYLLKEFTLPSFPSQDSNAQSQWMEAVAVGMTISNFISETAAQFSREMKEMRKSSRETSKSKSDVSFIESDLELQDPHKPHVPSKMSKDNSSGTVTSSSSQHGMQRKFQDHYCETEVIPDLSNSKTDIVFGKRSSDLLDVAIKMFPEEEFRPSNAQMELTAHIVVKQKAISNIPPLLDVFHHVTSETQSYPIVMVFPRLDPLPSSLSKQSLRKMISDVAKAANGLHRNFLIHMDIKDRNILYDSKSGQYYLTDLGLAQWLIIGKDFKYCGTGKFIAPEVTDEEHMTVKADVYSLGIVYLRFLLRAIGRVTNQHIREYCGRELKALIHSNFTQEEKEEYKIDMDLSFRMTELDPKWRPSMEEVVEILTPFLSHNNEEEEEQKEDGKYDESEEKAESFDERDKPSLKKVPAMRETEEKELVINMAKVPFTTDENNPFSTLHLNIGE